MALNTRCPSATQGAKLSGGILLYAAVIEAPGISLDDQTARDVWWQWKAGLHGKQPDDATLRAFDRLSSQFFLCGLSCV